MVLRALPLLLVLTASGCMSSDVSETRSPPSPHGYVVYSIGVSSDPYGNSSPEGFGVLDDPLLNKAKPVEIRRDGLAAFAGASWLDQERILVPRRPPPFMPPLIYRFRDGRVTASGQSPLPALEPIQDWSPDGRLIASQRIAPCKPQQQTLFECYRQPPEVYVRTAAGEGRRLVHRGHFSDWTPDGRLLVTTPSNQVVYQALVVGSGRRSLPLSRARVARAARAKTVELGPPRWSADGRFLAARVVIGRATNPKQHSYLVIATPSGRPLRFLTSPYLISMFAWSPRGHRLAYTTSGFPHPHELYLVDQPHAAPRLMFKTRNRHFDWLTWSPDADWLLVDDEHAGRWRLLASAGNDRRTLPRYGGKPFWCCPVNSYATVNG